MKSSQHEIPVGRSFCLALFLSATAAASPAWADGPQAQGSPFEVMRETGGVSYDAEYDYSYQTGFENDPRLAGDPNGNFIVAWARDDYGISIQNFDAGGLPRSEEFSLADSDLIADRADVAADTQGNFIVAWSQASGLGTYPIYAQRFTAKAKKDGNALLASDELSHTSHPSVDMGLDDKFVITWIEDYDVVRATRGGGSSFNGPNFDVNTEPFLYDRGADVAVDGNGSFLVVWPDPFEDGIAGRVFNPYGVALGPEFAVSSSADWYSSPAAAGLASGGFVVAWERPCCADEGVTARLLDTTGGLLSEFPVGPESAHEVAVARVGSDRFVLAWTTQTSDGGSVEGQLYQNDGTPEGSAFVVDAFAYGRYLSVAGRGEGKFVVAWDGDESPSAECEDDDCGLLARLYAVPEEPREVLLEGGRLIVTNRIPDDFYKSGGKVTTSDENIIGVEPGGWNDPRCLTDPPGTVRASIRFVSQTSGHDTGEMALPCEHWTALGDIPQRSFEYKDKKLADGPCKKITVDESKGKMKITCKGKKGVAQFPYDLEQGVSDGAIDVVVRLGTTQYCMSFPAVGPDGSDGKVFRGFRAPPPAACPDPGAPALVGTGPRRPEAVRGSRSGRVGIGR